MARKSTALLDVRQSGAPKLKLEIEPEEATSGVSRISFWEYKFK